MHRYFQLKKYSRIGWLIAIVFLTLPLSNAADMEVGELKLLPEVTGVANSVLSSSPPKHYEYVEPEFVKELTPFESGRNDSNPVWSPTGKLLAFERSRGDKREIVVTQNDGKMMQSIYFQLSETDVNGKDAKFFLPGLAEDPSYNSGITWANDSRHLAFMSNGGEGNYDIYSQILGGAVTRLTEHKEKDGLADWSPTSNQIVFISGRTGKGDVYLLDTDTHAVKQLTWGDKPYLYPRWSPDGKKIAVISGSTENHDIYIIDDPKRPAESLRALSRWQYDDLRPIWSPDGKKIAFYTNYNADGEQRKWSLAVISADGSDSLKGENLESYIVAKDVAPDIEQGAAWLADGSGLVYVKDDALEYNPIYIVDIATRKIRQLKTETKMNHDVACSPDGLITFRAQLDQWDQIFIAKLKK